MIKVIFKCEFQCFYDYRKLTINPSLVKDWFHPGYISKSCFDIMCHHAIKETIFLRISCWILQL